MIHEVSTMLFIDKSGLVETPRMLSQRFLISAELFYYFIQSHSVARRNQKKYRNPVMIRHPFEMPFHLLCRFKFRHVLILILYNIHHKASLNTGVFKDVLLLVII